MAAVCNPEIWDMPQTAVGVFLERLPVSLGPGSMPLVNGGTVRGIVHTMPA